MEYQTDDHLTVELSDLHRIFVIGSLLFIFGVAWAVFALSYFVPGVIFLRVQDSEEMFLLLSVLCLSGLVHLLYVGMKEEWFGAVFQFDQTGIRKRYPSGREQYIMWKQIERANGWTGNVRSVDGQRMYLGFYGNIGFNRDIYAAIYRIAGYDSLFARQFRGQPAAK